MEITLEAWEGRSLPLPPRAHGPWIFIPWWVLLLFYAGVLLLLHWLGGWRWVGLFSIGLTIGFFFYTSWECRATYYEALEHGLTEGMKFAHAALPVLINFSMTNDEKIHWRKELVSHKYPVEIKQFYDAAKEGIEKGYVKYIFHLQPTKIPSFLEDIKNTEHSH